MKSKRFVRHQSTDQKRLSRSRLRLIIGVLSGAVFLVSLPTIYLLLQIRTTEASSSATAIQLAEGKVHIDVIAAQQLITPGVKLSREMLTSYSITTADYSEDMLLKADLDAAVGLYARASIKPKTLLRQSDLSLIPVAEDLSIPGGLQSVTISNTVLAALASVIQENDFVDVLWVYTEDGDKRINTIVRRARVISVNLHNPLTGGDPSGTFSLAVSPKEQKVIQLAEKTGLITLVALGKEENQVQQFNPRPVTLHELMRHSNDSLQASRLGTFSTVDDSTGEPVEYTLTADGWKNINATTDEHGVPMLFAINDSGN